MGAFSNLDLIAQVDSYPYEHDTTRYAEIGGSLYTLICGDGGGDVSLGYVLPEVVEKLAEAPASVRGEISIDTAKRTISAFQAPTLGARSKLAADLFDFWRKRDVFPILRGWRDELWPVYGPNGELLIDMERSASGLFGVMRYGVHLTAFVRCPSASHGIKIWVPRRSPNKSTFPGMLDNTVAGGLMTGEDPFECVIREADEEANLPDQLVRGRTKHVGGVTYIYITEAEAGQVGLIYPEVQWIYDLELPEDVVPQPKDGEVAEFHLCTVEEVQHSLARGEWKPNCALVMLEFFIRHGILTKHNEPDYDHILRRIHRRLPFPGPHNQDPSLRAIDG
ncbi:NUDIX domain-containing protein [Colletotrichum gloeosporioides Cg-14]|uniref:NUDIX domain-containing protein n=1 Tax=Colletotrichum gloeosporioides (strain Cg-14) TaxID=1237896 RepID=T0K0E3_COLGC|nr:NUDIX domain-containing protein [Colletotrichum gloeosporioides Cg-14]